MPRQARKKSALNINHIILRGVNQQIIFEDEYDYQQFISILRYYKDICNFRVYAYCLMNNHIHLLIGHTSTEPGMIMQKIEVKFVRWYNQRYQRIGNLFQDRYKSEPVNDLGHLKTIFRYTHQNPLHAGLETIPGTYFWSSYHAYADLEASFIDIDKILSLFQSHVECMNYLNSNSDEKCMEHHSSVHLSDVDALRIIQAKTSCNSPSDFQRLDLFTRNQYLQLLKHSGISVRQLSRLTGILLYYNDLATKLSGRRGIRKENIMYKFVTDKVYLKESYRICAGMVNQLVQNLKGRGIQARMAVAGSKKRGLVTQNEREAIDYDFNLWIEEAQNIDIWNDPRQLKTTIIESFNEILVRNDWKTCDDSTSVITTKKVQLEKGNKTPFRIDLCIVREDDCGNWYRLIHKKTGNTRSDQYCWEQGISIKDLNSKEKFLKPAHWMKVRETYLVKKNMHLSRQDTDRHSSYNCYIEAINEVYAKVHAGNK